MLLKITALLGGTVLLLLDAGAALDPLLAGAAMLPLGAAALPLHFLLMNALLAAFALWPIRQRVDRIVDAPAHVVPPLRTSQGALEMMVTEPAEAAPAGQASGPASP